MRQFFGEIGFPTSCKICIATKTSSYLGLISFVTITHFEAVFLERNSTSLHPLLNFNKICIALKHILRLWNWFDDYTFWSSLTCGKQAFQLLLKLSTSPLWLWNCLETHIFWVSFSQGKKYFQRIVRFELLLKPPLGLWKSFDDHTFRGSLICGK